LVCRYLFVLFIKFLHQELSVCNYTHQKVVSVRQTKYAG